MKSNNCFIHIYHTNDIHSHFDSWPQISRYLLSEREKREEEGATCFVFDLGDHVDRFHPFTEGTAGKGNVALLNRAGYDAVTIGNNEGITMSKRALMTLYEGADFDVLLCNLKETDGSTPKWLMPYRTYETKQGVKVGVVGATAKYTDFYAKLGWAIEEPKQAIIQVVDKIRKDVDVIICLSHLGVHEDRLLAEQCKGIDVILGAHTHHLFIEGEMVGNTLLAATGKFGQYVGHVTLQFDEKTNKLIGKEAAVVRTVELGSEEQDIEEVNDLIRAGNEEMEEKVFYNPEPLKQELFKESPLSSFFGQALVKYTAADCAMFNAGIFLGSLDKGWVTRRQLHALLPHPINPCVVTLDGQGLHELYELAKNDDWPQMEIKGLGFRGTLMGEIIFDGLSESEDGELFADGKKVVDGGAYRLATLDLFTFGFFFPSLQQAEKDYYMPELIRDVAGWYGKQKLLADGAMESRFERE